MRKNNSTPKTYTRISQHQETYQITTTKSSDTIIGYFLSSYFNQI